MLKTCTILLMLAAVGTGFPRPPAGSEEKCMLEFGISKEEVQHNFPLFTNNTGAKIDRKYKCFTKCLLAIVDLRTENGTFDVAKFVQDAKTPERKEMVTKIANDCMVTFENEKDECEYSFMLMNCIMLNIYEKKKYEEWEKEEIKV